MEDEFIRGEADLGASACGYRLLQGTSDYACRHAGRNGETEDALVTAVLNEGRVHCAFATGHLSQVRQSDSVRFTAIPAVSHQVGQVTLNWRRHGRHDALLASRAADPGDSHEPGHAVVADLKAFVTQFAPQLAGAVTGVVELEGSL